MIGELFIILFILSTIFVIILLVYYLERLSSFFQGHYTFFKLLFIILYSAEQALFIISSFVFKEKTSLYPLLVSLFALIVLTTTTIQIILLETIHKRESDKLDKNNVILSEKISKMRLNYENKLSDFRGYLNNIQNEEYLSINRNIHSKK